MYLLRWVRRYIRKKAYFIDAEQGVRLHKKLSFLYLFFAWNAFFGLLYTAKKGKLDYALDSGLKTEAEASQSKAIATLEMLGVEKAKVITLRGFSVVKEEEYESDDYKKMKEQERQKKLMKNNNSEILSD